MTRSDAFRESSEAPVLRFDTLRVERFNGLKHGLEVEPCDGVTVIYGSNASGKTTLAQAIRALLWPESVEDQRPIVEGAFSFDGTSWRVDLEGTRARYLKEQHPESPPPLPPAPHGRRYHLYLHDLLAGGDDQAFADLILQEAQGGIDVEGAAEALDFEVPTRRTSRATRAVTDKRSALREAKRDQEAVREDEKRLAHLREQRAEAQAAVERVTALDQALEVVEARATHEEAEARLDSYPPTLEDVRGDEGDRLETLQERIRAAEREIEAAEEQRAEAHQKIEESRIPEAGLPQGRLEELRTATSTLQEAERDVRGRTTDLSGAREAEEAAWRRLGAGVERETAAAIDLPEIQTVEQHARAVEEHRGRQEALAMAEELFGDAAPEASLETLREGLRHLHRWLRAPAPEPPDEQHFWKVAVMGSAILVAAAGGLLTVISSGLAFWVGLALAVLGLGLALAQLLRWTGPADREAHRRSLHREAFERLSLGAPEAWSREAVEEHADRLLDRLRTAAVAAKKEETWARLQSTQREMEERAKELEAERERLAEDIGLDLALSSRSLSWLVDRLSQWQAAYDEQTRLRAALEEAKEQAKAARDRVSALLAPYDLGPVTDASEAQGAIETLQSAWDAFRTARRRVEQAEEDRASAETARREAEAERLALYEQLGLEEGEEEALRSLVSQHESYRAAVEAKRSARATLKAERRRLRRCEGYEEWMESASAADLRRERETAQSKANREEEYVDEIKEIEHAVAAAREGGTVEQLQAEYRQVRDQLAQNRTRDYARAVGKVLADLVQEETRDRGLPPVFHRARGLFAEITNDRYELTLDRGEGTFRAYDHVYDDSFALDALSSGTKVQLLLSVRVAFVETQEQGCRVPLVLDETLANSDAERARAIIDAVRTICRRGRQVFYLTAQADEAQKWKAGLDGEGDVDFEVISLTELDQRDRPAVGDGARVPSRPATPDRPTPDDTSHEALRDSLEVPQWTPRQPVSRLHLWYLIDTPEPLLSLLEAGTRTWGQLQFQRQRGGLAATPLAEQEFEHVRALARAVASWKEAWQVGRGRPVDRPALEQTDAVTDTFIDGVSDLAEELGGDAEALLRTLRERSDERVSGFRSAKAEDLETYLRDHGYLDPRDRHSPADMWQYVLADVAPARESDLVTLDDLERLFARFRSEAPSRP